MWRQGTAWTRLIASALGILTLGVVSVLAIEGEDLSAKLAGAKKLLNDQNFSEAAQKFREVIRDEAASSEAVVESMRLLLQCQQQLRIESELDDDLRTAIAHHPQKFRVLDLAATQIEQATHYGTIADQQFTRGYGQGRGRFGRGAGGMGLGRVTGSGVNVLEQDRLQALRWRRQALQLAQQQGQLEHAAEIAEMQLALAETLQLGRSDRQAWNLQALTDISQEPNYLDLEGDNYLPARYAPVTETGEPVLYAVPDSWDAARSDGERLHWVLSQAQSADSLRWQARMRWADFLHSQFAVDTLQQDRWLFRSAPASDEPLGEDGVHAIHTLQTNETIARLASGVKRFSLSDEFNPLHIYQEVAQSSAAGVNARAAWNLLQTFLNRRQYPQAAEQLEAYLSRFGDDNRQSRRKLLDNIRQPRLQFDPVPSQLAGRPATLSLLFRNAKTLSFTARKVDIEKILRDTKDYYRQASRGPQAAFGGQKNQSPPRLSVPTALFNTEGVDRYLLQQVAEWNTAVEPRPNHWDRRIEIETPLEAAGLYLIEADAQGGMHKTRCLVWIQDTVLVRKPLAGKWLLHAADAESGRPIADATIELFGFGPPPPSDAARPRLQTKNFAVRANSAGLAEVTLQDRFQWFCVARSRSGRLALLDFEHLWQSQRSDPTYGELKAYGVSDRPLYRPGEKVKAKFWLGYAVYGDQQAARLNNASLTVRLSDPQGIQVAERQLTTDEYGGCELEMDLSESAPLGRYHFQVVANAPASLLPGSRTRGNGSQGVATSLAIRVEEYRKPEFEVEILAPDRPVALGETVKARIQAKYYFGAPVTDAEVTVKVERSTYRDNYYPVAPYDWCYGPGYWWFAEDYVWYPGWKQWRGCLAPQPDWRPGWGMEPPELVLEQQLQLDSTGLATVEIDTALAKALYGQEDHQYTISVDVRDSSRRTLSAQGSVIAAQDAFKIYSWTDRGHYRVGDRIEAHFRARMLDDSPVVGRGTIDLLRITYDERLQPQEQVVASFPAQTDPQGQCVQELTADRGGQYRVRLRLQDAAEHTVEGAYIFTVRGPGMAGKDFRYAGLELTPDKKHYAPGESVQLQIAANRGDALVAVFVRPVDGAYPAPRWLQLENKSTVLEIPVGEADQPNFFVEAYTIYDGEFHSAVREIIVPPAERVLDVQIAADKREYLPGEAAELSLTVKDPSGKPVVGSCVVAVYDRSLEQIAGDSLPPDIREFFWKWQRHHQPRQSVSLQVWQQPITIEGQPPWMPLGIFGASLADDLDAIEGDGSSARGRADQGPAPGGFGIGGAVPEAMPMMARGMSMAADSLGMAGMAPTAMAKGAAGGEGGPAAPTVRKDFADSALWLARLITDDAGRATAKLKMPENLTSWTVKTWSLSSGTRVGSATTEAVTRKPLLVRLQTPRFLVERDEVVISTIVHNDLPGARQVQVALEIDGQTQLELLSPAEREQTVSIESHQQARVDWRCRALAEGTVTLRTLARTEDASDAMQLEVPIVVHGLLRQDAFAGTVRSGQNSSRVTINIPAERRVEQSRLTVRLSPSLAASMIDALPYLAEYPYGCTEQTLNRFLPSAITQRTLQRMNVDLAALAEKRNNLNAQELGDPAERRQRWKRFDREAVFDQQLIAEMVDAGVRRLSEMQNGDGGWGWFSGPQEQSAPHTTATVVRGLLIAQQNDIPIVPDVLERGIAWLEQYQQGELQMLKNAAEQIDPSKSHVDNTDALVFHVLVLAERSSPEMQSLLYEQRQHLSTYGKALLAWATHQLGNGQQTAMLRRNIEQFLVEDAENETAYLRDQTAWWYWYGSEIEANAIYLKLLAAVEPRGRVAPRLVKYLLNNRKHATYWNSTRDTALVVEAFADYITASGETSQTMTAEVWLSGKRLGRVEFTPQNLFSVNNSIELQGTAIPAGEQQLEIRRQGDGNLYWNAYAANFTLEQEIAPAGLEVKIERRYYHLQPTSKELSLPGERANVVQTQKSTFERTLIEDLQALPSGALVEVELLVHSKNDYEYLVIEDRKPASLETVETQSGYFYSGGLSVYRELRDRHVGLCIRWLPKGNYSLRYQLRSEAPGTFTALPAVIQGMYAPELRGNSADFDLQVVEPQ